MSPVSRSLAMPVLHRNHALTACVAGLALAGCVAAQPEAPVSRVEAVRTADGVQLLEAGRPLLFYRTRPEAGREAWRVNYVHPLHAPDGTLLTEDAPIDHLHQRGVYWAWRRILVDGSQVADGWVGNGLVLALAEPRLERLADGSARIEVTATWSVPLDGRSTEVIEETSVIHAHPLRDGVRRVDFELRLRALRDGVALAGTDDEKGYGGPSLRLRDAESVELASGGRTLTATLARMTVGPEVELRWGEASPLAGRQVTLACRVQDRPWTEWVLRQEPSMQNCAFPGRTPRVLPTVDPLRIEVSAVLR